MSERVVIQLIAVRVSTIFLASLLFFFAFCSFGAQMSLEEGFASPPVSTRPGVYWFWVDGNVTREGITADLESMKRVGLGAALLFDVTEEIPKGPVRFARRRVSASS